MKSSRVVTLIFTVGIILLAIGCAKPKVQVQVSRDRVQQGEEVSVSWTSKDSKSVTLNGETVDKAGSKVFTPDQTTTYTAVAKRGKKEAADSKVVNVNARAPRPTITLSADQDAIRRGQSTTLRWTSTNSERVTISDLGTVPSSGSRVVSPSQSTTYDASATGPGGNANASTRVSVSEETPVDTTERPRTVNTNPALATIFAQKVQAIFFELDKAELTEESKDRLRRAAAWLAQGENRSIAFRIEGNCDPRGTEEYNIGLGERRAQAAKEFLVTLGIEAGRMQTVSYGKERAAGTSEGDPGVRPSWAFDRRDEFIYVSGGPRTQEPIQMFFDIR